MRTVEYLSPTSFALFEKNREEFFKTYIIDNPPPRFPQTQPMSIGSAFDAYVKSFLYEKLFGKKEPKYELRTLFEAQVEAHNRDWAWENGRYVFEQYLSSGALADLMLEIQSGQGEPRFEFDVRGAVSGYREGNSSTIENVTFMGKPDVTYFTNEGQHVIADFKVNGYCSNFPKSPEQGYLNLRAANRTTHGMHKNCMPSRFNGVMINIAHPLDQVKKDWAAQLSIYAWLCGEPVGSDFIVAIEQVCCAPSVGLPKLRFASHKSLVTPEFQKDLFNRACEAWEIIHSDHFFREMSKEDSIEYAKMLNGNLFEADPNLDWLMKLC